MRDIFEYKDNFATYSNVKSQLKVGSYEKCPEPVISVIMPVYKRPKYFKIALDSVLNQDFNSQYEIVVVDNNTDEGEINENQRIVLEANSDKILYYRNDKNIGMYGNWNRGIELSRANHITYCHDDDIFLPTALSTLYRINSGKSDKAVFASSNKIDVNGDFISRVAIPQRKYGILKPRLKYAYSTFDVFIDSPGFGCGCLFSRKCMIEIGGYSEEFYPSADYALNAVYIVKFGAFYSKVPTFNYRIAENESLSVYQMFVDVDKHFRESMREHIALPNLILNRIILANYRTSKIRLAVVWGKKDRKEMKKEKISDKIIMKIIGIYQSLKRYKITF